MCIVMASLLADSVSAAHQALRRVLGPRGRPLRNATIDETTAVWLISINARKSSARQYSLPSGF
jgi:hypothetical protein